MRYTVIWTRIALDQLADIWTAAPDRQSVTDAADRIDQALRLNPDQQGEELNGMRVLFDWPLVVLFRVLPDDRQVHVLRVRSQV
jgi:plasmid stabilization system protein ParE